MFASRWSNMCRLHYDRPRRGQGSRTLVHASRTQETMKALCSRREVSWSAFSILCTMPSACILPLPPDKYKEQLTFFHCLLSP